MQVILFSLLTVVFSGSIYGADILKDTDFLRTREDVIATNDNIQDLVAEGTHKYGNDADLDYINTSKVTDMSELFRSSDFNGDINGWDVSNVTNMYEMFSGATFFNQNLNNWDVSSVENMRDMFKGAEVFEEKKFPGILMPFDILIRQNLCF